MKDINRRIELLTSLGEYMTNGNDEWECAKRLAAASNPWFTPEHVEVAVKNIASHFLQKDKLQNWLANYYLPQQSRRVGIVMAGNIPLVGFHDFLCGFVSGHSLFLKISSKDEVLIKKIIEKLTEWEPTLEQSIVFAERLNNCNAYIATGSNNTARYFEYYFGKYPNIIRKNRTSVAILDGSETDEELAGLADDVYLYFGLGCRNVTQLLVPKDYNFEHLLKIFKKYDKYINYHKYKNNCDYHLAIYLLNGVKYMSNESILLVENESPFSAVSVLHYKYYEDKEDTTTQLRQNKDIQVVIGKGLLPFGDAQKPSLDDYADGIDTMAFLCSL